MNQKNTTGYFIKISIEIISENFYNKRNGNFEQGKV